MRIDERGGLNHYAIRNELKYDTNKNQTLCLFIVQYVGNHRLNFQWIGSIYSDAIQDINPE